MPAKKVVYLLGAGSTIAEAFHAGIEQKLTLRDVSELVVEKAKEDGDLEPILGNISTDAIKDIEMYISLLESMRIEKYLDAANKLKGLFCEIIEDNLQVEEKPIEPVLAEALLQLHEVKEVKEVETLEGVVTVNYDNLVDRAFQEVFCGVNYGISCKCTSGEYNLISNAPLLIKLHGSFNWRSESSRTLIDEQQAENRKEMLWIPPGIEKERVRYPFNILWGKAFETLLDCDLLRIVGCSLSKNDWGLISLLFQTQRRIGSNYEIELVNHHKGGLRIREENGFLANVKVLGELDGCQDFADEGYKPESPFEEWLKIKTALFIEKGIPLDNMNLKYIDKLREGTN